MSHGTKKASAIGNVIVFGCAIIEPKNLLAYVAEQVKRLDVDSCRPSQESHQGTRS